MNLATTTRGILLLAVGGLILGGAVDVARGQCPANEFAKLLASDGAANDQFGSGAGISGRVAVFGARFHEENGVKSGAAYVFRFHPGPPGQWVQEAKLVPSDGEDGDSFGHSVAVSGDTVLIGAYADDDNGASSGSAYVFRFDPGPPGQWVQEAKLVPSDGASSDQFGQSVAICGDPPGRAVVGAFLDHNYAVSTGSAYVFRFDPGPPGTWVQEQKLLASDWGGADQFGCSVAIVGDPWWRIVVGAHSDDNENGWDAGSVCVFRFDPGPPGNWVEEQKLLPDDGAEDDSFGWAVGATGAPLWRIVVGAYGDDDKGSLSGSAYVFRFDDPLWVQEQKLLASDGRVNSVFGKSLAASGNIALIGSHRNNENGVFSGAAYAFRFRPGAPGTWIEEAKLSASDGAEQDRLAWSLAVSGDTAAIGANRDDDLGSDSGSGYVFHGLSDCNSNGSLDLCDIAMGTSHDDKGTGLPDECDPAIPTLSQWGLIVMAVLLVAAGAMVITRRGIVRARSTAGGPTP